MRVHLKIKIKSLADEARTIRKEEKRTSGRERETLHNHRVHIVRREQRAALLAYAFLKGRPYSAIERSPHTTPIWKRVEELIRKYGEDDLAARMQRFVAWKDAAVELKAAA